MHANNLMSHQIERIFNLNPVPLQDANSEQTGGGNYCLFM